MANRLFTVCAIFHEHPYVQYQGTSEICRLLAEKLANLLTEFYKDYKKSKIRDPRGNLLILDRSFDLIAPVVHDYYYQTNVSEYKDGFKGDDGEFKLEQKTIYLND